MKQESYVLLIATGQSPQVLTETVWSLARQQQPALFPSSVEVVTTAAGEAYLRARLLGELQYDPISGTLIEDATNRWAPFCQEVLGMTEVVPLNIHVPKSHGLPLEDVQTLGDDAAFADLCYGLVERLTREDMPPVVGSIAGGRKTMSAHLMTAFSVFARPADRLTHVLVSPDPLPGPLRNTFYYPTEETAGLVRIRRVDIEFPRLRGVLRQIHVSQPEGPSGLRALLAALEPHTVREEKPAAFRVTFDNQGATLAACREDGSCLDACRLTPAEVGTFLALADAIEAHGGDVSVTELYSSSDRLSEAMKHPVHRRRELVEGYCRPGATPSAAWMNNGQVSRAVSRVNRELSEVPILERFLAVESEGREDALRYRWPEPLPGRIEVHADIDPKTWLLDHVVVIRPQ